MFNSNIWPNSAPKPNDFDFDLSVSLKVKCDSFTGLHMGRFLAVPNSNISA